MALAYPSLTDAMAQDYAVASSSYPHPGAFIDSHARRPIIAREEGRPVIRITVNRPSTWREKLAQIEARLTRGDTMNATTCTHQSGVRLENGDVYCKACGRKLGRAGSRLWKKLGYSPRVAK